jgi:tRNA wybutosine-synthesizing protein 2
MRQTPYDEIVAMLAPRLGSRCDLLPRKWEKLGSVLVLRFPSELADEAEAICGTYADVLGCSTVLNDVGGIAGQHRVPQVRHLWGSRETVTVHHENGIRYKLDPCRVMFSSGNMAERIRMGTTIRKGETVVDLFAGIGYFTLPMAVSRKPSRVYACEINPDAYGFLNQNIVLNEVTDIVVPLLGDNREVAPQGVADRVVLGYLEATSQYFPTALECLRDHRGLVHYHEAVPTALCPDQPLQELQKIADRYDRSLRLASWREVKSYAPGISHVVLDVEVNGRG